MASPASRRIPRSTRSKTLSRTLVARVQANPRSGARRRSWSRPTRAAATTTAGYVQILDFFGDGTRSPADRHIAVRPEGPCRPHLLRSCLDAEVHRAQLGLPPLSERSRDNLPNPVMTDANPTSLRTVRRSATDGPVRILNDGKGCDVPCSIHLLFEAEILGACLSIAREFGIRPHVAELSAF